MEEGRRDERAMLGGPHRAQEGVLPQHLWWGGCPPLGSLLPPVLQLRVPGSALCDSKTAGSDSACGTEGLRTGGAVRVGEGWWDPPRASYTVCSTGMPKREASGVAACSSSSDVLVRDLFSR